MQRRGIPVKVGAWLYNGSVSSQVMVVHRDVRFGTGDYEDEVSVREDVPGDTFEVLYAVAGDPSQLAGGGQFDALADALAAAGAACGPSLAWQPDGYFSRDDLERSSEPETLCRILESLIQHRLAHASNPAEEVLAIVNDLRSAGHDIWSWDESLDFSIWGDDYINPPRATRLVLQMRWPSSDSADEKAEVEITFGPWPQR